jgi:hypothetical protein
VVPKKKHERQAESRERAGKLGRWQRPKFATTAQNMNPATTSPHKSQLSPLHLILFPAPMLKSIPVEELLRKNLVGSMARFPDPTSSINLQAICRNLRATFGCFSAIRIYFGQQAV